MLRGETMKLSEKHLEVITNTILQYLEREERKKEKEKYDARLHNIKLLLKNYRGLVLHCEDLKNELDIIDNMSIQDLDISTINLESIQSIKKSKEKSFAMVVFIRSKMAAYKKSCTEDELKYFRVLEKKYLTEFKWSIRQIAESENIDISTIYRYLDKVIADLPVVFFGVDAIQFK